MAAALVLGALAFVGLLAYGLVSKSPGTDIDESLARGEASPAPGFALPPLTGGSEQPPAVERAAADGSVELAELRGAPVVLNFWASWCAPCREEAPILEAAWRRERRDGVVFLGLNQQDLTADARDFAGELGMSYPSVRDESDSVGLEWGVTGLPETFFVSREGEVVGHAVGAVSDADLQQGIAAARAGRPIGPLTGGDRRSIE